MRFIESEIDSAMRLRAAGLAWGPEPGHYVFDINGIVRAGSPFQAGVFLLNSTNTFEAMVGGEEEVFENFVWLPTWEECRAWLKERGLSHERVAQAWQEGVADGLTDRESLYTLMLGVLEGSVTGE